MHRDFTSKIWQKIIFIFPHKKPPLLNKAAAAFAKGVLEKKRGRKEDLRNKRQRFTASAALDGVILAVHFEQRMTEIKTFIDVFVNAAPAQTDNEKFSFHFIPQGGFNRPSPSVIIGA